MYAYTCKHVCIHTTRGKLLRCSDLPSRTLRTRSTRRTAKRRASLGETCLRACLLRSETLLSSLDWQKANGRICGSGGRLWTLKRAEKAELLRDRQRGTNVYSPELWLRSEERPFWKDCIRQLMILNWIVGDLTTGRGSVRSRYISRLHWLLVSTHRSLARTHHKILRRYTYRLLVRTHKLMRRYTYY